MKLFLDTSSSKQTIVKLGDNELIKESTYQHSQVLIEMIQQLLSDKNLVVTDLTQIEVFTGPGSFTGLRVGVAVANALGYSLGIPVNGKTISSKSIVEPKYE